MPESLFLIKLQGAPAILLSKESQVFSCEFCEISMNTFSYRTPPVAASLFSTEAKNMLKIHDKDIRKRHEFVKKTPQVLLLCHYCLL